MTQTARTGTFYITTPIYYPSNKLHIGHAYSTVAADALARYHRLRGDDTWFLTGTDEHGQKIERAARAAGKSPQQFVDDIVAGIKELWGGLQVSYDDFIRTTEDRHSRAVQEIFRRLYDAGDIYKSEYEGWYCAQCETFFTETQLKDGKCPDHEIPVERLREESYFFRLSKYADRLLEHIDQHPDFIQPASRRNEVVSFIKQGLEDLCVSRTSFTWGIPVPFDEKHVIYVWIDALANYITALGWPDGERYRRFWPASVHLIGKDILRFHAIIWPIILMALGEPLPERVFGHGWVLLEGGKMSKSKGNVVDPMQLISKYGVDPVRYFLLREVPFGQDGVYSEQALILRTNVDLANDLGNLLSRTTAMIDRFAAGVVPAPAGGNADVTAAGSDRELPALAAEVLGNVEQALERLDLPQALAEIWRLVAKANKFIDEVAPWNLAKAAAAGGADAGAAQAKLQTALYDLAETLRVIAVMLTPFLVQAPEKIYEQLGLDAARARAGWQSGVRWGGLPVGTKIRRGDPIFPRIEDTQPEAAAGAVGNPPGDAQREHHNSATTSLTAPVFTRSAAAIAGSVEVQPGAETAAQPGAAAGTTGQITIEEFQRIDLRVAEVLAAERVPGADRLLKLQLRVGEETRQIVSGIAQHYQPEQLVGKLIVLVANLKPAKIRGVESHGMLLAASEGGRLALVAPEAPIPSGARVK